MPIRVTENWSGRRLSFAPPWEAEFEYKVTGTDDQAAALAAVPYQRGDGHPANKVRLRCDGPKVKAVAGPFSFIIGAHFSLDVGAFGPEDPDPLLLPPRITWTTVRETVEVDHDLDGRAMVDAAGSLQTGPRTISYKHLRIVKNFPYYDILLSAQFECSVNEAAVSLSGITVEAQHMYCTVIEPAIQDYAPSAAFLPIVFEWDVVGKDVLGQYPFQTRLLNAGRNGWFSNPDTGNATPGRFVNGRGDSLELDVRMGASGLPLAKPYPNSAIKVGSGVTGNFYAPIANPQPPSPYATEFRKADGTLEDSASGNTDAVFFIWKNAHVRDYGPLLSMF